MASIEILGDEAPFKQRFSVRPATQVKLGHMFFCLPGFGSMYLQQNVTVYQITSRLLSSIRSIIIIVNISNLTSIVITAISHSL